MGVVDVVVVLLSLRAAAASAVHSKYQLTVVVLFFRTNTSLAKMRISRN
jgi:hypothetical protein